MYIAINCLIYFLEDPRNWRCQESPER